MYLKHLFLQLDCFFFCVFDKKEHLSLLQLDNGGAVVLCFFCVSVSVSV